MTIGARDLVSNPGYVVYSIYDVTEKLFLAVEKDKAVVRDASFLHMRHVRAVYAM